MAFVPKLVWQLATPLPIARYVAQRLSIASRLLTARHQHDVAQPDTGVVVNINFLSAGDNTRLPSTDLVEGDDCGPWRGLEGYDIA